MLSDLRQRCPTTGFLPYKQDPLTGEAVEFLPCMGKINGVVDRHGNELIIGLPHPLLNRNGTIARLLPYSFVFYRTEDFYFDEAPFGNPINCTFTGTELLGRVFFCITKKWSRINTPDALGRRCWSYKMVADDTVLSAAQGMQQFLLHCKERLCKRHLVDVRVEQTAGSRM